MDEQPRCGLCLQVQKPALRAKDTHSFSARTRTKAFDPQELEPHRAQRIIANRQSAHRTRVKRMQFVFELEKQASATRVPGSASYIVM